MRGWKTQPTKKSGQLVFLCLVVFGLLTYYYWEAMLVSYLSARFIVMPFNSIPELITNTDYKIVVLPGSSMMESFKQSNNFYWQEAWKNRIEPNIKEEFKDFTTWITKVCSGRNRRVILTKSRVFKPRSYTYQVHIHNKFLKPCVNGYS